MEMKLSPGAAGEVHGGAGCKKRPPSRLQKKAPASLQVEAAGPGAAASQASPAAWADGRTPIPLLSPLVTSPAPLWEGVQGGAVQVEARSGGEAGFSLSPARHGAHAISGERQVDEKAKTPAPASSGGWRHPAMPTHTPAPAPVPSGAGGWRHPAMPAPVAEPASLAPLFKSQCTVEVRNAQQ